MESGGLRLYAHRPDELVRELTAAGFETVEAIAVDVGVPGAALISRMLEEPESRANLLTILHDVESDPGILGFAEKLIAVGHRPLPD